MGIGIGINGFGRIGRLVLRAAWAWPELEFRHINEIQGGTTAAAHLLEFDSVHGRWPQAIHPTEGAIAIADQSITFSEAKHPEDVPWGDYGVEIVLECSGKFRTPKQLAPYFAAGVKKVIVAAPVKEEALNIVMGVNDHLYNPHTHHLLTAASCTTNCLAPVVKVISGLWWVCPCSCKVNWGGLFIRWGGFWRCGSLVMVPFSRRHLFCCAT